MDDEKKKSELLTDHMEHLKSDHRYRDSKEYDPNMDCNICRNTRKITVKDPFKKEEYDTDCPVCR